MTQRSFFTSESVSEGHPDKVADQLSDGVVDLILSLDPSGKAAIETLIGPGHLTIAGEAFARVDDLPAILQAEVPKLARRILLDIGYTDETTGFDGASAAISVRIGVQSAEIRDKVERQDGQTGAGDQGLMFGYACDENDSLMPAAIHLSHRLVEQQARVRKAGALSWLLPDAKSQVTVSYLDGELEGVATVVLSTQHRPIDRAILEAGVREHIIDPVIPVAQRAADFRLLINPGGPFTLGGPAADCGLTGRKIIVDNYGGSCPHGGGAFSGKDPSKVDRSAAYAARWVAKHVVTAGLARRCTLQLAYAIGSVEPVSLYVNTHGTATVSEARIEEAIRATFDLSPGGIIRDLGLLSVRYLPTAAYGHFGRAFPWEETPRVSRLRQAALEGASPIEESSSETTVGS